MWRFKIMWQNGTEQDVTAVPTLWNSVERQFNSLRFTSLHTSLMAVFLYSIVVSYCSCAQTVKHPIFISWFVLFCNVETIPNKICFIQTCSLSFTLAFPLAYFVVNNMDNEKQALDSELSHSRQLTHLCYN
jgi:hypothetical protein